MKAELYQDALTKRNIEPVLLDQRSQCLAQSIISRIQKGNKSQEVVLDLLFLINELKSDKNCEKIIFGCTEFSLISDQVFQMNPDLNRSEFTDCIDATVEAVVKIGKGDLDIM